MAQAPSPGPLVDSCEDERPRWDSKFQYLLSCIGFAVGLGNIWRFPYLCQTHGGGAFLIPYFIALVFEGIPLFHIELAIGQRLRRGSIGVWTAICPYLGGVGLGCFTVNLLVSLYYNTVLVWVLWYFLNSFQYPLPWSSCPLDLNRTGLVGECQGSSPVSYFWYRQTLNITADIEDSGTLQWRLVMCSAACWAVLYLCVIRGIETTGKAIYFTALFPYLVLTIFLIRGLTLPGAIEGLMYLFTPDMQILQNPRVWLDAATQIFFSLSLAFGGHIALASYNPPRNNCKKDAVTIALVNSLTSLYASITIFSVMGFKATNDYRQCLDSNILSLINEFDFPEQSIPRDDYPAVLMRLNTTQPDRVAQLPLKACCLKDFLDKPTWRASQGETGQGTGGPGVSCQMLEWPAPCLSPGLACLASFLLATCFTLQSGSYWLEIFDNFAASLNLIIFAFLEVVGVIYVYGMRRFCDDIEWMTGRRPSLYWRLSWWAVSPMLLLGILLAYIVLLAQRPPSYKAWSPQHEQFPSREEKLYPGWVRVICMLLSFLPLLWVPAVALAQLLAQHRRRLKDTQPDTSMKPEEGRGC
ncbi:solute carrier family 6 member 18, transcript variant X3 [Ictidomys tridecemlineatus]|uniref:inactive sodium-dependent neutral amino acid transporter B(0)AT3 isoform X2 n=1 Tax=Ictidomys tridecemlineatus TaxID=43179 RepID=UPI00038BC8F6|nr:inactive sodium-dependent neutral amino acid transporter B(0)AT3 isoform X2 [Ictidomys tridecemlineatus]KAG3266928.1 solute carrier family 6 member 18, transcript variant X3 [Ictidomys tridecemlineatus]